MADLIGLHLGQYEITALLGKGGMAAVYRARQASMERDVAIKVIKPDLSETGDFTTRFRREAHTVASLNHILKVFDYGQQDDLVYLVMELLTGGSLADRISKGPLSLDMTGQMLDQVASALDYAHERGITHRDLKPQNVLLDAKGNAVLTDFGIVKLLAETTALTQSGMAMGTPTYMSPEQWRGQPADARSDNYALGVMLFEMLTGRLPFLADTPFGLMHQHVYDPPPSVRELRADVPPEVETVIRKALAKNRDQRFASAGELAAAFKGALTGQSPVSVPPRRKAPTATQAEAGSLNSTNQLLPKRRRTPLVVVLVTTIFLLLMAGYAVLLSGPFQHTLTPTAPVLVVKTALPRTGAAAVPSLTSTTRPTASPILPTVMSNLATRAVDTFAARATLTANAVASFTRTSTVPPTATPNEGETLDAMVRSTETAIVVASYSRTPTKTAAASSTIAPSETATPNLQTRAAATIAQQATLTAAAPTNALNEQLTLNAMVAATNTAIIRQTVAQATAIAATPPTATQLPGAVGASAITLGFVSALTVDDPFFPMVQEGIEQAASDFGAKAIAQAPKQIDVDEQTNIINYLRSKKISALIVEPDDPEKMIPVLEAADKQGIPVITVDTFIGDGNYTNGRVTFPLSHIGTDHEQSGRIACDALAQAIGKGGKVYIQNIAQGIQPLDLRERGCKEALAAYPSIKLVGVDYCGGDAGTAQAQTTAMLQREKDLAGIFYLSSFGSEGIERAVSRAGLQGKVKIAAFDAGPHVLESLKAGIVTFAVAQRPYDMGYLAAAYAIAHLNGVTSIPKLSVTGLAIINNQNISDPAISRLAYVNNLDKPLQPISNYTIGFVAGIEHPYSRKVERGINDLARLLGIKVSARFPQQWNSAVQIPLIEAIATEPINALIAVPVDTDQTTPAFEAVDRQGVPVIHVDTFIGDGNYSNGKVTFPRSYIGSDNEAGGRFACEALARAIGGKGKVYIQNSAQGPALTDLRETGCKNALTHYPDIKLVGVDYNNSDPGRAQAQAAAVLEREKDVSGMYIINDPAVEAVARAVADAGKTGTVRIVAFDSTVGNMASLKAGHISMIVAQKPYDMGFLAAICAVATAHGVDSFPRRMPTDLVLISASNVNEPAIANLAY